MFKRIHLGAKRQIEVSTDIGANKLFCKQPTTFSL